MKKRPFLLLELLIAIGLVSLAAVPLLSQPLLYMKQELKTLREVELQWHASAAFIETKVALSQNTIPWNLLTEKTEQPIGHPKELTLLSKGSVNETISVKAISEAHDTMSEVRIVEIIASYAPLRGTQIHKRKKTEKEKKTDTISFSTKVCVKRVSQEEGTRKVALEPELE